MAGFLGMDPDAVDHLAHGFVAQAKELDHVAHTVQQLIRDMESFWHGVGANEFAGWWHHQHGPALLALSQGLKDHAHKLSTQAAAQRTVSTASVAQHGLTLSGSSAFSLGGALAGAFGKKDGKAKRDGGLTPTVQLSTHGQIGLDRFVGIGGAGALGVVPLAGSLAARAYAKADVSADLSASRKGVHASVQAGVAAGVAATAKGSMGNRVVGADGSVGAKAEAYAKIDASGHLGPDGSRLSAGGKVGVMASADVSGAAHLAGVDGAVGVHAFAGAGVIAHVDQAVSVHEIKASVKLGVALGLGAGWDATVDVRPDEVWKNAMKIGHVSMPHLTAVHR